MEDRQIAKYKAGGEEMPAIRLHYLWRKPDERDEASEDDRALSASSVPISSGEVIGSRSMVAIAGADIGMVAPPVAAAGNICRNAYNKGIYRSPCLGCPTCHDS